MGDDPECYALNLPQGEYQGQAIHKLRPANDQGKNKGRLVPYAVSLA